MVAGVAKCHYFSVLMASMESHPAALLRVTQTLLGKADPEIHLQGHAEKLLGFIPSVVQVLWRCPGSRLTQTIWEWFDSVGAEEVDRTLQNANATTCVLDLCPSWLVKAAQEASYGWVQAVVNSSLLERVIPAPFRGTGVPATQEAIAGADHSGQFLSSLYLPFLRKVIEKLVALQLQRILEEMDGRDPFPSGFRYGQIWDRNCIGPLMDGL